MTTWAYCLSVLLYIATLTITLSNGYLFERVNPVIWIPTENYVEEGITTYDLDLTYGNPCDTVPTERTHRYASDSLFPEDYAMYKTIKRDCQNMFDAHWSARLIELASMTPQNNQQNPSALHRRRRNPFVLIQSGDWDSTLVEEGSALEKGSLLGQTFRTALFVYESAYFA